MVFAAQWTSLPVSPSPGGVAGFALGIFVLLVLLGALSLDSAPDGAGGDRRGGVRGAAAARGRHSRRRVGGVDRRARLRGGGGGPPDRPHPRAGRPASPPSSASASASGATSRPPVAERLQNQGGAGRAHAGRAGDHGAVLGHPRLHHAVGGAAARRRGAHAERVLRPHGRQGVPARRHAGQVHRRRDHGVLRRAAARRGPRPARARVRAGDARRSWSA